MSRRLTLLDSSRWTTLRRSCDAFSRRYCHPSRPFSSKKEHSQLTEEDYRYHLSRHIRDQELRPCSSLLSSLDTTKLERALPVAFRDAPLKAFQSKNTTLQTACVALELYISRVQQTHQNSESREQTRALYADQLPGKSALRWFREHDEAELNTDLMASRFLKSISFCLVAEGSRDSLWQWILASPYPRGIDLEKQHFLGSFVNGFRLRSMVESLTWWSTADDPLEEPIQCFRRNKCDLSKRVNGNVSNAGIWILKALKTRQGRCTSADNFEFMSYRLGIWIKDPAQVELERAHIDLFYPTGVRVDRAWKFLKSRMEERPALSTPYMQGMFLLGERKPSNYVFWFMLRTAQALNRKRRSKDARSVLDFAHRRMPQLFTRARPSDNVFVGRPSLRREPSPTECKFGVTIR